MYVQGSERQGHLRGQVYDTVQVPSDSHPGVFYTVDVTNCRCSCPGWVKHAKHGRRPCRHLRKLGVLEAATL